jgi:pimeloyl-ACP methyl ester carboxylesterase
VTLLPGSGSDEIFISGAFARPLGALGLRLHAPRPVGGDAVVRGYLAALDAAVAGDPGVLVGGVSLGAQVAVRWAADRAARGLPGPVGLLLALPAWTGEPGSAPAAVAARLAAAAVARDGLAATVADARANTPGWLGAELARAWTRHGAGLADAFAVTALTPGPTESQLAALRVPVGLVGLSDDPVHPLAVARRWRELLPRAELVTTTLAAMGADRETLGRAAALAWLCALRR